MRKLVLILFAICVFAGCDEESDSPEDVRITSGSTKQVFFADNTAGESGITFTTTGAWGARIASGTKADAPVWLSVDPANGDKAGTYTINITLEQNLTGEDRKAEIQIICSKTTVTITVEQKGKTQNGEKPKLKLVSRLISSGSHPSEADNNFTDNIDFTYDAQDRFTSVVFSGGSQSEPRKVAYSYEDDKVVGKSTDGEVVMTGFFDKEGYISTAYVLGSYIDAETGSMGGKAGVPENFMTQYQAVYENGRIVMVASKAEYGGRIHADVCRYVWQDGNLVSGEMLQDGVEERIVLGTITCEYGTLREKRKPNMNLMTLCYLDRLSTDIFGVFGLCGKSPVHLLSKATITQGGKQIVNNFSYEFTPEGYISKITTIDNQGGKYTLEVIYE